MHGLRPRPPQAQINPQERLTPTHTPFPNGYNFNGHGASNGQFIPPPVTVPIHTPSAGRQTNTRPIDRTALGIHGVGAVGVELLPRINFSLKSGISEEVSWALSALVQLSYGAPQLVSLKTGNLQFVDALVHEIEKAPFYKTDSESDLLKIEGVNEDKKTFTQRQLASDATLVLRNISFDQENARVLANIPLIRKILTKGLLLPEDDASLFEFKIYCVDIIESISSYIATENEDDSLFLAVMISLERSDDRTIVIGTLRALTRLQVRDDKGASANISQDLVDQITAYLLIPNDEELVIAALDFIYQYSINGGDQVKHLVGDSSFSPRGEFIRKQLIRLLTYNIPAPIFEPIRLPRRTKLPIPSIPPEIPQSIITELIKLPEPDRATNWMRSCYEEDPEGEVTQISLWRAYESQFEGYRQGQKLLPAVDFIKNVSSAFKGSAAMVVQQQNGNRKFIIRGIQLREYAIHPESLPNGPPNEAQQTKLLIAQRAQRISELHELNSSAAMVLISLARSPEGSKLLQGIQDDLCNALYIYPALGQYINDILTALEA